jgi:hypothetical protein
MHGRAWCLVLAALAACGSSRTSGPITAADPATAAPKRAFATTISSTGVGPLGARTPDDKDVIAGLLPGLTVELNRNEAEDHDVDEYTIKQGDKVVLFVVMDRYRSSANEMFRIDVFDPMFATATGIAVGSTVGALAAKHPDTACKLERYDPDADIYRVDRRLYCETPAVPNVAFDLDPESWRDPPAQIPVRKLADRKIQQISWVNPD